MIPHWLIKRGLSHYLPPGLLSLTYLVSSFCQSFSISHLLNDSIHDKKHLVFVLVEPM